MVKGVLRTEAGTILDGPAYEPTTNNQQPRNKQAKMKNLMLHCGAHSVKRADVENVPTPESTRTWTPIPHATLIELVEDTLKADKLKIVNQEHGLTGEGRRYFGLMQIANGRNSEDYAWVLGL